ncbi:MAG: hypothetical protein H6Q64_1875 [Firmicutes bacterium]|nr:hypothetical protein [Bacillota bacterium]
MKKNPIQRRLLPLILCLIFMISNFAAPAYALDVSPVKLLNINYFGGEAPAAFKNVQYSILNQSNIVKLDSTNLTPKIRTGGQVAQLEDAVELTPQEIIQETGYIQEAELKKYTSEVKPGTIFVDEKNKLAFKVNGIADENTANQAFKGYTSIVKAEPYEVLADFKIPQQEVKLTRGNITHFGEGMKECLVTGDQPQKTYVMSQTADQDEYSGKNLDEIQAQHLTDPILEFKFPNRKFTAYTRSGGTVEVTLSGYLGIDNISVNGHYSCKSGYEFYLKTGEEMYLKAVTTAQMNEEVCIPIIALGVDAKVADVKGGLYLIVGLDGQFTLVTEARQWLMIDKFGIGGGTFLYVPTSFHPLFKLGDHGLNGDASFNGAVNGHIMAGPMLELEIFGFDAAGAGALFGGGASCVVQDGYIQADIYGIAKIYAKLMGHGINILNWTPTLFQKRQLDTDGFIISIKEADAYRGVIWGNIKFDHGSEGGVLPYANAPFGLLITDASGNVTYDIAPNLLTDAGGNFYLSKPKVEMNDKDLIYIRVPSQYTQGKIIQSKPITPSFPFNKLIIEKIDYFNDTVEGHVPSVFLWDPATKQTNEFIYDGLVDITLNTAGSTKTYSVPTDPEGRFVLAPTIEKPLNVLPTTMGLAQTHYHNFVANSNSDVKPSVDFTGRRIAIRTGERNYYENGQLINEVTENETFIVYNLGGEKKLTGDGIYNSIYRLLNIDNVINPDTGYPIFDEASVEEKQVPITLKPYAGVMTSDGVLSGGASKVVNNFVTRFAWAKPDSPERSTTLRILSLTSPSTDSTSPTNNTTTTPTRTIRQPSSTGTSGGTSTSSGSPTHGDTATGTDTATDSGSSSGSGRTSASQIILPEEDPQNTVDYQYNSWHKAPEATSDTAIDTGYTTAGAIRRVGELTFSYEGAEFTIKDPGDEVKRGQGRKVLYQSTDMLNFDRYLNRMFWSTVSPTPDQGIKEKVSNFASIPAWSSSAAQTMLSKGIMDLGANAAFKSGNVTRGECAAFLTKSFQLTPDIGKSTFRDMPPMYPYMPEINAAVTAGLINGYSDTAFGAFDLVSREQMAVIVMRGMRSRYGSQLSIAGTSRQFTDSGAISEWARQSVSELSALGIMNGNPDGTFNPKGAITFNEMAVLLNNLDNFLQTKK